MKFRWILHLSSLLLLVLPLHWGCTTHHADSGKMDGASSSARQANESAELYSVDKYDPQANAAEDLADTVSLASASGKRIILEIGGNW
ncbi:MAG: hypothetical protein R3E01_33920 [Pirellulaceae bacterium]